MRKRSALGDDAAWVFLPRGEKMLRPEPPEKKEKNLAGGAAEKYTRAEFLRGCSACSTCNSGGFQNGIQVDKIISKPFIHSSIEKKLLFRNGRETKATTAPRN